MPDEIKPDKKQASTQDAQLAADEIAAGSEPAPTVDIDQDYETSKQYSVSDVDRTGQGASQAASATQSQVQSSGFTPAQPQTTTSSTGESTGNPKDYMKMAKDIKPENEAVSNVNDDLIKKALEKGQPG